MTKQIPLLIAATLLFLPVTELMGQEEFTVKSLSLALDKMKDVCNNLVCSPQLKEKAEILRKEIQSEYEKEYEKKY